MLSRILGVDEIPKANMHEFVNDLATALRTGCIRLPALKHLEITDDSNWNLYSGPDDALLAALPPTPQLWWMAERPQHVRCRKLSRWRESRREPICSFRTLSDYTILSWLSTQICVGPQPAWGRKVYEVLKEHGASEKATELHYFHPVAHELEPTEADKKLPTPCLPPRGMYRRLMVPGNGIANHGESTHFDGLFGVAELSLVRDHTGTGAKTHLQLDG